MHRSVLSLPGAICVEGFSPSPRHGAAEKQWLVITVDLRTSDMPVHFSTETSSQVEARRQASPSTLTTDAVAVIGIVRFLGGTHREFIAKSPVTWLSDRTRSPGLHGGYVAVTTGRVAWLV
jgi:hypothetical protein